MSASDAKQSDKTITLDSSNETDIIDCSIEENYDKNDFLKTPRSHLKTYFGSTKKKKGTSLKGLQINNENQEVENPAFDKDDDDFLRCRLWSIFKSNHSQISDSSIIATPTPESSEKNETESQTVFRNLVSELHGSPYLPFIGRSKLERIGNWLNANEADTAATPPFSAKKRSTSKLRKTSSTQSLSTRRKAKKDDSSDISDIDPEVEKVLVAVYGRNWKVKNVLKKSKTEPKKSKKNIFSSKIDGSMKAETEVKSNGTARRNIMKTGVRRGLLNEKNLDIFDSPGSLGVKKLNESGSTDDDFFVRSILRRKRVKLSPCCECCHNVPSLKNKKKTKSVKKDDLMGRDASPKRRPQIFSPSSASSPKEPTAAKRKLDDVKKDDVKGIDVSFIKRPIVLLKKTDRSPEERSVTEKNLDDVKKDDVKGINVSPKRRPKILSPCTCCSDELTLKKKRTDNMKKDDIKGINVSPKRRPVIFSPSIDASPKEPTLKKKKPDDVKKDDVKERNVSHIKRPIVLSPSTVRSPEERSATEKNFDDVKKDDVKGINVSPKRRPKILSPCTCCSDEPTLKKKRTDNVKKDDIKGINVSPKKRPVIFSPSIDASPKEPTLKKKKPDDVKKDDVKERNDSHRRRRKILSPCTCCNEPTLEKKKTDKGKKDDVMGRNVSPISRPIILLPSTNRSTEREPDDVKKDDINVSPKRKTKILSPCPCCSGNRYCDRYTLKHQTPTKSFLASLSVSTPKRRCDPEAQDFKVNFHSKKEELTMKLFKLYNDEVFDNALPDDMEFTWNAKMRRTAGYCYNKKIVKSSGREIRESRIELSAKIVDRADRLRDTLIHELCHSASWIVDGQLDGHGTIWLKWSNKAMERFPELPQIKRCHNYDIVSKYTYKCVDCGYEINRYTKSINTEKKRCGYCFGMLELFVNKKKRGKGEIPEFNSTRTIPAPNSFALFVKENYQNVKNSRKDAKHAEIMKILSQKYGDMKMALKIAEVIKN